MPNALTKFLDKLTGVDDKLDGYSSEQYQAEEYVTVDLNEQQMKQLEQGKQAGTVLVKFHKLKSDMEYQTILDSVRNNSIVILDISHMKNSDFTGLKLFSGKLKLKCNEMGWGLGALSNELLMVTPGHIKFEKKKEEGEANK